MENQVISRNATRAAKANKPQRKAVIAENIPAQLKSEKSWIVWCWEQRDGVWTKPPYQLDGKPAKSNDPTTWSDFNAALNAANNGSKWDGIGFMLAAGAGFTGIDWDDSILDDGKIDPAVLGHIKAIDSYTEVSPSGKGLKTLVRGQLPAGGHHNKRDGVEVGVFDRTRYFCITGHAVPLFSIKIEDRQEQLDDLVRHFWPSDFKPKTEHKQRPQQPSDLSDAKIIEMALRANDGGKFRQLWQGCISEYDSDDSRADQALCNKLAFWCGRNPERIDALFRQSGLMRDKWDREDYRQRTINKAINQTAEVYQPRFKDQAVHHHTRTKVTAESKPAAGITSDEILHALGRGEDGDAELFIKLHRGRFCFDHADRRWYEFKGHSWTLDRMENAIAVVTDMISLYATEADRQAGLKHKAVVEARTVDADRHGALEDEILKRIGKLHGRQRKQNVLSLAAAGDGSLGITGEEWDADPWVIGCPNGVVNLKAGELRQGKPADYIKTVTNAEWRGIDTPCPVWEKFLDEVFMGDVEIITYIQTLLGYGLIGDTPLHIIPIFWGRGRNGKGTLLEIIKFILGPCAFKAEAEMLLDQKSAKMPNAHNSGILALQGKRIVWTSEVDEGRRLNAAKVKELVGGDTLSGRAAYGRDHKEFRPSHLLLLLTNTKPAANSADYALWQRIHLIEFGISFVENSTDPKEKPADLNLAEKLKAEGPGVLAWMVRGCLRFNREGLKVPGQVRAAVARYRAEEDILGNFIAERCIEKDSARTAKGVLYQAYKAWCEESGHPSLGGKRFYQQMDDRFDNHLVGRHQVYIGIGVREG